MSAQLRFTTDKTKRKNHRLTMSDGDNFMCNYFSKTAPVEPEVTSFA